MCSDQPPQPESMGFHVLAIILTPLLKQIYVFSVPQPTTEALVFLFFLNFILSQNISKPCYVCYIFRMSSERG